MYRRADLYLLDDPLSAVGSDIGALIFDKCVMGLLRDRAVVMVTRQLQHFNVEGVIIHVLETGGLIRVGGYDNLSDRFPDMTKQLVDKKDGEVTRTIDDTETKMESSDEGEKRQFVWKLFFQYLLMSKTYFLLIVFVILFLTFNVVVTSWDLVFLTW